MFNFTIILFCLISKLAKKKIVKRATGYREENAAFKQSQGQLLRLKPVLIV